MTPLLIAALGLLAACTAPRVLARARWPYQFPRAGLLAWALLFVATFGSMAMAAIALASHLTPVTGVLRMSGHEHAEALLRSSVHVGGRVLDAVAVAMAITVATAGALVIFGTMRRNRGERRRHLRDLSLVGRSCGESGVLLVDSPEPMAYAIPGRNGAVVLTSAACDLLSAEELTAVLTHERTHIRARHAWLLSVAASFANLRWLPGSKASHTAVRALTEMHADDAASRRTRPAVVARALAKLAGGGEPSWAPAIAGVGVAERIERLVGQVPHRVRGGQPSMILVLSTLTIAVLVASGLLLAPILAAAVEAAACLSGTEVICPFLGN